MKNTKNSLRIIIAMILTIVMIGSSFAFADSLDAVQTIMLSDNSSLSTGEMNDLGKELSGSRTIVATTFFVESGSYQNTVSYDVAGSTYGTLPTPTKTGAIFVGWFPDPMEEGIEVVSGSTVPQEDTTLYAHWGWVQTLNTIADYGVMLNIYGSNLTSLYDGMNITMWAASGSNEQKWILGYYTSKFYIRSYVDKDYGLNVYRAGYPWNCTIHYIRGNETDAQIDIDLVAGIGYRFWLSNWDLQLTAAGTSNGDNVYWSDTYEGNTQLW